MKKLLLTVPFFFLIAMSTSAFANGGSAPNNPGHGGGGTGNVTCNAVDSGWEEHRPHPNCRACLREHGRCTKVCSRQVFTCTFEGTRRGQRRTFEATAPRRRGACQRAREKCQRRADRGSCIRLGAQSHSEVVSRNSCRRHN